MEEDKSKAGMPHQSKLVKLARSLAVAVCAFAALATIRPAAAEDHVTIDRDGARIKLSGKIIVEAQDGGVLLLDRLGKLWTAQPNEIVERTKDDLPFKPPEPKALGEMLLEELPAGFDIHTTARYVICHNTSKAYAQWCGALFERLHFGFTNFWSRRGLDLHEPEMPLIAIVFADKQSYKRYAANEVGEAADSIIGYYNLLTNRIVMYDLTGVQETLNPGRRTRSSAEINHMLSQPEAGSLVATIVHEATHQIAFNCGLQTRLADIPIWLSEGVAMYFETPDLRSSSGWRGIGEVNRNRLQQFRGYLRSRPKDSLEQLLVSDRRIQGRSEDKRFQGRPALLNAYAEAWSLTYYLLKYKPKEFIEYMKMLGAKSPLIEYSPEQRRAEFEAYFGSLPTVDNDLIKRLGRLR